LKALFVQEIDAEFEVVIVDSGSCDGTLDIIRSYPVKLYQIKPEEFNHGLTRNFGISLSEGRYIILMTQDAIPYDRSWMKNLVGHLQGNNDIAGVYSRQIPHKDSSYLSRMRVGRFFTSSEVKKEAKIEDIDSYNKLSPAEKHRLCSFDDVSSCLRRQVWEKIPFSKTDFAEDIEWAEHVLKAGYRIIYEPDSVVYHSHDFSVIGWYKRNRINSNKLSSLFGLHTINNLFQLIAAFFLYTFRDSILLYKIGIKAYLSNICFVPLYAFSGALGQYMGSKEHRP
jgi:rhamnosyltransferase